MFTNSSQWYKTPGRLSTDSNQTDSGSLRLERWPYKIVGIPQGKWGWRELFPPKVKHGNDYMHCCWCWVVSLSSLTLPSLAETSTQCSLSPRWPFSNVNSWLTVRGRSRGVEGPLFILTGGEALHRHWKFCIGAKSGQTDNKVQKMLKKTRHRCSKILTC